MNYLSTMAGTNSLANLQQLGLLQQSPQAQLGLQNMLGQMQAARFDVDYGATALSPPAISDGYRYARASAWADDGAAILAKIAFWRELRPLLWAIADFRLSRLADRLDYITDQMESWLTRLADAGS